MEESTARLDTDFNKDIEEYGPIGEEWFKEKLSRSPKTVRMVDVSSDPRFRKYDIDCIQFLDDETTMEDLLKYYDTGHIYPFKDKARAYEVKTDTQIMRTGNIAYEAMSWTNPGCMARTLATFIIYTGIDENNEVKVAYQMDTMKLRYFVLHHFGDWKYMRPYFMKHKKDEAALYLIKTEILRNGGILKNITIPEE